MRRVIGIIGPLAAGKDSVSEYVEKLLHVSLYQISSELKTLAQEKGIKIHRENLINLSRDLVSKYGDDYLARRIFKRTTNDPLVIVGMRQLGQIDYLKENSHLILIGVNASSKIRFERVRARNKSGDPLTFEEFIKIEKKDDGNSVQRISDCMKQTDYSIINENSIDVLYSKVEEILRKEKLIL